MADEPLAAPRGATADLLAQSEAVRVALVEAFLGMGADWPPDGRAAIYGLMVGMVQVLRAHYTPDDKTDAAIRASILQLAGWAVNAARAEDGLKPLHDT